MSTSRRMFITLSAGRRARTLPPMNLVGRNRNESGDANKCKSRFAVVNHSATHLSPAN
ncbi:hypothetical protein BSU04_18735 [Caballeronia sordidicola]|uniref:Uncharacterized protein n=1 Tax=Caballeronia sordidicola TaxID=196367 RepID=A0A226X249_CABSO|nr:hypothetical protein BSU04_18735 [Caballeronia sordidicola]